MDFNIWSPGDPAGIAAALTVLAAIAWKVYFRTRSDHRGDQTGVIERNVHKQLAESYDLLVMQLRDEITRLRDEIQRMGEQINVLSASLDAERVVRQQSDARADGLRARVLDLEQQLKGIGDLP